MISELELAFRYDYFMGDKDKFTRSNVLSLLQERIISEAKYCSRKCKKFIAKNSDVFLYNNRDMVVFNMLQFHTDITGIPFGYIGFDVIPNLSSVKQLKYACINFFYGLPKYPCKELSKQVFPSRIEDLYS